MQAVADCPDYMSELFPDASDGLRALWAAAAENAGLVYADFLSLRDLLALSGYERSEPLHALLLLLLVALEQGSLCVEISRGGLQNRLSDLVPGAQAGAWTQEILGALEGDHSELIGRTPRESRPVILWRAGDRQFLYFQKYLRHDRILREELDRRLTPQGSINPAGKLKAVLEQVLATSPLGGEAGALALDRCQRTALGLALLRNFTIISGGPGTGKTSIVVTLLRCLVRLGVSPDRIALAAPTGRAAQRLTDALRTGLARLAPGWEDGHDGSLENVTAHTLHSLLRYNPARDSFGHHRENPLAADVVIVDEVSMVGLVLMARLLQAVPPQTRLILLGDKDQLPSVDAGAVLAGLVPADGRPRFSTACRHALRDLFADLDDPAPTASGPADYLVTLEENYRSQPQIREVARAINRQEPTVVEQLPVFHLFGESEDSEAPRTLLELEHRRGCWFLPVQEHQTGTLRRLLLHWAERQYLSGCPDRSFQQGVERTQLVAGAEDECRGGLDELFRILGRGRLLTLLREGPWGCVDINRFLAQHLRPRWDRTSRGTFFAGAPVLITRNDHVRQLYNGDVGIALRARGGGLRVVFPRQSGYSSYPADTLPASELGFALTVHKSQGSEYGQVLLLVPPSGGRRLLTKEMIYTGVTRAKDLAVLCGTREALQLAISRRVARESGLQLTELG